MDEIDLVERTRESTRVYKGGFLTVYSDQVELPDGEITRREWIDHPGASAVLPILEDGTVAMVRQYRYPARKLFLEIPAGKLDHPGEDPEEAARRELAEETGYRAGRMEHLASLYNCVGYSNEVIHLYLTLHPEKGNQALAEGEHVEVVHVPFSQLLVMARAGELEDMKTTSAVLLAAGRINRD